MNEMWKASHRTWSISWTWEAFLRFYIKRSRYKEVSVKYILRFPHHGYRSFTFAFGWRLTFPSLWRSFIQLSFWTGVRMPCEKNENGIVARSEESITLMTSYRFSSPQKQILHIRSGWHLTVLYKDHGVGRQKELLAHAVRLRILACRNDSSRKRIFSLQLTAHS